jgi:hypothetical protein
VKAGDRVELRSPAEILATLDDRGALEGVPFMPEMLKFFGETFTVRAQVRRACDTVNYEGVRRLKDTVILDDLRCDGSGHAGCGAQCRLYWKEAWLRPASSEQHAGEEDTDTLRRLEKLAAENVHVPSSTPEQSVFRCQATELLRASEPVSWYDTDSFVQEVRSGNVGPWRWVRAMTRIVVEETMLRLGRPVNKPFKAEELEGQRSRVESDNRGLRPGQLVQIRSKGEIRETLAANGRHRGLWFDREMVPYCGQTARVKAKVERFIDEGTGQLVELTSDCYILDDVVCQGFLSDKRWFCPRAIYPWWRESWLEPVEQDEQPAG